MADYKDILFVIYRKDPNKCKICEKEYNADDFYKYRRDLCKSCFSKEANFCRIRKLLIRTFKELNVDKDTAIKILKKERDRIYRKLQCKRYEDIVVV
jgi:hypothetical protein